MAFAAWPNSVTTWVLFLLIGMDQSILQNCKLQLVINLAGMFSVGVYNIFGFIVWSKQIRKFSIMTMFMQLLVLLTVFLFGNVLTVPETITNIVKTVISLW